MSGAGNTFIIFDLIKNKLFVSNRSEMAKKICSSITGVGADGFVFIEKLKDFDFEWDFYNNDGSKAEACGNASRCVVKYFSDQYQKTQIRFKTAAGVIQGEISNSVVSVQMPQIQFSKKENEIIINSGVPHLMIETHEIENLNNLKKSALQNRYPQSLNDKGANVTFVQIFEDQIKSVTFERGVEDFTQACGTGAVAAAAYVYNIQNKSKSNYDVQVPGGWLNIDFTKNQPILSGPAEYVCEFKFLGEIK